MAGYLFLAILLFSAIAYFVGQQAGKRYFAANGATVHSLPGYHGAFVAVWVGIPALILVLMWLAAQGSVINSLVLGSLPAEFTQARSPAEMSLLLSEIRNAAGPSPTL